ncbi:N-acetyldiaminopimelate deacetylase [Paenactinomyces guangxiensis]|uniref:N-acetyldiaminopimelate deacetylase n=1 Tax=Paenactinomyces guangxiensis TaxID=1490290 RepID=A0A7W2A8A4_9BACL|nr:N-acetyldiaminopimelate deacetylase [Paenactinomyces guangxiensis]MBA4493608.1 N-acetyldiaminopimelate deacetylase [Paenactinomyces guangxiensis]MBH8590895.1 N-acetyldiaminopimelate deacetylase [Paenactinomyces guangxiensis]
MAATTVEPYIQIRRQLHQIPEPGFAEFKTQQFILSYLSRLPSRRLQIQTWRTGILAKIPGQNPRRCIGYRTDMDGLPITEQSTYNFRSRHDGYMHACGHDMHMAIALGILTHFVNHPIDDDLVFIFQPAEEGPGGALPMLQSEEFRAWKPDLIFALHIAPEYPVGTIATRPGILFANTSELFIDLTGTAGHAALPHRANDMVIAASQLAIQLQSIVSRNIDPLDSVVLTIGKMEIGTKQNVIAGTGRLEGTIRTLSAESMQKVKSRIEAIVRGIELGFECRASIDWGANYCQVKNDEKLTRQFMEWINTRTEYRLVECREAMTGEDFGYFLTEIPGFMFWLGADTPFGLHHPQIEPDEGAIPVAIDTMTRYIRSLSMTT